MKILELFSGTESFSKVARAKGHECFTVDNDPQFKPNLCIDIRNLRASDIIDNFGHPDIIWASPPCTTFSVASISRYWDNGKPKNEKCLQGIAIVKKTIEIIKALNPKFFIIENPRGMLRKQEFMPNEIRKTVSYCQYGHKIMKPTDLWTNVDFKPKMCKPKAPCHERASRGAKAGIQGFYNPSWDKQFSHNATTRAIVPEALCKEILEACENEQT